MAIPAKAPAESAPIVTQAREEHLSPARILWRRLKQRKVAMLGGYVLAALYLAALFAGFLAPYHYETEDRGRFFHPPIWPKIQGFGLVVPRYEAKEGQFKYGPAASAETKPLRWFVRGDRYKLFGLIPTTVHLFGTGDGQFPVLLLGTDQFGRDVFSRLLYGAQISLSIGLIGIALSFTFGMINGGISGYFGGKTDVIIMRACELIMSIPSLYLILALRNSFPTNITSTQAYAMIVAILSLIGWASMARVVRGMALSLRERPFILAARAAGLGPFRIILRHILPNTASYVIVAATLSVPYYILGEVVLSYLAVGIQEPEASWGNMLTAAQNTEHLRNFPWLLAPGGAIFVTVLAFNFLGDGLRDAADSRS